MSITDISFEAFCNEDIPAFTDCTHNAMMEIMKRDDYKEHIEDVDITPESLFEVYNMLPESAKFTGLEFGFGDTEFRDNMYTFCSASPVFKNWIIYTFITENVTQDI